MVEDETPVHESKVPFAVACFEADWNYALEAVGHSYQDSVAFSGPASNC